MSIGSNVSRTNSIVAAHYDSDVTLYFVSFFVQLIFVYNNSSIHETRDEKKKSRRKRSAEGGVGVEKRRETYPVAYMSQACVNSSYETINNNEFTFYIVVHNE